MSLSGLPTGTVDRETSARTYPRTDPNDADGEGDVRRDDSPERHTSPAAPGHERADVTELRRENELLRERLHAREERLQEVIDRYESVIDSKDASGESVEEKRTDGASGRAEFSLGERLLRAFGLRVR